MMKVAGYVKNPSDFSGGCVSGDYAHANAGENWVRFEATSSVMKEPTGYMAVKYVCGSLWLDPETYSLHKFGNAVPVHVDFGDDCDA